MLTIAQIPRRFVQHEWGGTETVVMETSKRLIALGHHTEILCPNALSNVAEETMQGVPVKRYPYFYPYFGLSADSKMLLDKKGGNLMSFPLLRALSHRKDLNVIHLHTVMRLGGIGRMAARRLRIPYIVSLHGGFNEGPANEASSWLEPTRGAFEWGRILGIWLGSRHVLEEADAIICVGKAEQEATLRRYPGKKVVFIPNGVDTQRYATGNRESFRAKHGIPAGAYVSLTMGRIDTQKNQAYLIRRLKDMLQIEPRTHLLLIGPVTNAHYLKELEAQISELGLGSSVTLIPGLDPASQELVDAYHAADVFVLPSLHEPFGIVILEAWSAGLPVLASRTGGVPSFVVHGTNGLLFDTDDNAAFLEGFRTLATNRELSAQMAQEGRSLAARDYSWDKITMQLVQIYQEVIDAHGQKSA